MGFSFVVLALAAAGVTAITIITPGGPLFECETALLIWDGQTGRTQISVYPGGTTIGPSLESLPEQTGFGNTYSWLVDQPPGVYTFVIKDLETGETAFSGLSQVVPNPSGDKTCENI